MKNSDTKLIAPSKKINIHYLVIIEWCPCKRYENAISRQIFKKRDELFSKLEHLISKV